MTVSSARPTGGAAQPVQRTTCPDVPAHARSVTAPGAGRPACPRWESNPHRRAFKALHLCRWVTGAARRHAYGARTPSCDRSSDDIRGCIAPQCGCARPPARAPYRDVLARPRVPGRAARRRAQHRRRPDRPHRRRAARPRAVRLGLRGLGDVRLLLPDLAARRAAAVGAARPLPAPPRSWSSATCCARPWSPCLAVPGLPLWAVFAVLVARRAAGAAVRRRPQRAAGRPARRRALRRRQRAHATPSGRPGRWSASSPAARWSPRSASRARCWSTRRPSSCRRCCCSRIVRERGVAAARRGRGATAAAARPRPASRLVRADARACALLAWGLLSAGGGHRARRGSRWPSPRSRAAAPLAAGRAHRRRAGRLPVGSWLVLRVPPDAPGARCSPCLVAALPAAAAHRPRRRLRLLAVLWVARRRRQRPAAASPTRLRPGRPGAPARPGLRRRRAPLLMARAGRGAARRRRAGRGHRTRASRRRDGRASACCCVPLLRRARAARRLKGRPHFGREGRDERAGDGEASRLRQRLVAGAVARPAAGRRRRLALTAGAARRRGRPAAARRPGRARRRSYVAAAPLLRSTSSSGARRSQRDARPAAARARRAARRARSCHLAARLRRASPSSALPAPAPLKALYNVGAAAFEVGAAAAAVGARRSPTAGPAAVGWRSTRARSLGDVVGALVLQRRLAAARHAASPARRSVAPLRVRRRSPRCSPRWPIVALSRRADDPATVLVMLGLAGRAWRLAYRAHRKVVGPAAGDRAAVRLRQGARPARPATSAAAAAALERVRVLLHAAAPRPRPAAPRRGWRHLVVAGGPTRPYRVARRAAGRRRRRGRRCAAAALRAAPRGDGDSDGDAAARRRRAGRHPHRHRPPGRRSAASTWATCGCSRRSAPSWRPRSSAAGCSPTSSGRRPTDSAHRPAEPRPRPPAGSTSCSTRARAASSLAAVAVDSFREVNDTLGHEVGDELLARGRPPAARCLPATRVVGRIGGGRFAVAVPAAARRRRRRDVRPRPARRRSRAPRRSAPVGTHVRLSVGVVAAPEHGARRRDARCAGPRRRCTAPGTSTAARSLWEPAYEVPGSAGSPSSWRCARRWPAAPSASPSSPRSTPPPARSPASRRSPAGPTRRSASIGPDEFVPLAEASGLMGPLTASVLRQSLTACKGWQRRAPRRRRRRSTSAPTRVLDPAFVTEVAADPDRGRRRPPSC